MDISVKHTLLKDMRELLKDFFTSRQGMDHEIRANMQQKLSKNLKLEIQTIDF